MHEPTHTDSKAHLWQRFKEFFRHYPDLGLSMDISRMFFPDTFFPSMEDAIQRAFAEMQALESGAIANADENRMVGHYWLRAPELAPDPALKAEIEETLHDIHAFARSIHSGTLKGEGGPFQHLLVIGIGGSALGPQFVSRALSHPFHDKMQVWFFDNTDPDGMDNVLASLNSKLGQTLCLVISKSGGTKETRNGMLEAQWAFEAKGLSFPKHAVAVTGKDSQLDQYASLNQWLKRFPMWDWVGGRTSETSAVGLLPAALQGFDIDEFLRGCRCCDTQTRQTETLANPAAVLALMWFASGHGNGDKAMVVLPYKDRLELFSRYLQQLIMESLGKQLDRHGKVVHQGLTVYGNKGSTDQHAYVQQLRDGLNNFFVQFIEVLHDRLTPSHFVEPQITSGDFLFGFLQGTRQALHESQRPSMTLTIDKVSPFHIGVLIALFERAVGLYASLVNINAYHQPGVEAGKKAASSIMNLQGAVLNHLQSRPGHPMTADDISLALGKAEDAEMIFKIGQHLAMNHRSILMTDQSPLYLSTFQFQN